MFGKMFLFGYVRVRCSGSMHFVLVGAWMVVAFVLRILFAFKRGLVLCSCSGSGSGSARVRVGVFLRFVLFG